MAAITKKDQLPPRERLIAEEIERLRLSWRYELEYLLEQFDKGDRLQVRNDENNAPQRQVSKYEDAYRNGAQFPAPVVSADGYIIDGNTRIRAMRNLGRTTAPVFVLGERYAD